MSCDCIVCTDSENPWVMVYKLAFEGNYEMATETIPVVTEISDREANVIIGILTQPVASDMDLNADVTTFCERLLSRIPQPHKEKFQEIVDKIVTKYIQSTYAL